MKPIKLILLMNNQILISQVEEVTSELGEPDCRLTEPFLVDQLGSTLSPWLIEFTTENQYMISSDKIITLSDPKPTLLEKYQDLTK